MAANAEEVRNMQFYAAARANDIPTVTRLIGEGANIEYVDQSHLQRNSDGNVLPGQLYNTETALGVAAFNGNIDMARILLDAGARVGGYQLDRVVRLGNIEFARLLLERNPEMARGSYLVLDAIESGNNDLVRLVLEHGADPNATRYGIPAIARAVHINNTEVATMLVEGYNADTNYTNREGLNLLYHAIQFRNFDIARLLFFANPALVKPSHRERMPGFLAVGARGPATMAWELARRERLGLDPKTGTRAGTGAGGAGSNAANKKGGRRSTRKSMKKHRRH